ncbi:MAG TPA: MFS transporter, partial [Thermoanaerobaculia bacterium]|nr:MFS transporter [Thermoanaerobaculia bacterium]
LVEVQWVLEAYAILLSSLLLTGGSLGDRFGRRRVFLIGTAVFALASLGCALAPGVRWLIAFRGVQGIGGALLVPGSLAILASCFGGSDRGRAIGTWSGFSAMTTAVGPVLGGWLVDHLTWRWAFLVNIPIACAVVVISLWRVPESRGETAGSNLDWPGALLATVGLGGVVYALLESPGLGWKHPAVLATMALGLLALAAFVAVERRAPDPMLRLDLFRSRRFAGANVLTLFLYSGLSGVLVFLPLDLIQVHGYSAAAAGASLLPFIVLMFLLSRWSGGLYDRMGARLPLVAGCSIAAAGFVLFVLPGVGGGYWTTFFPATVVLGLGMATAVAPLTTAVMSSVPESHSGAASGINNAVSRVAGLVAVAVFSVIMLHAFERRLERKMEEQALPPAVRAQLRSQSAHLAAAAIPQDLEAADRTKLRRGVGESFVAGFRQISVASAALALLAAATAAATMGGRVKP